MQRLGTEPVGQPLGRFEVLDQEEGVSPHLIPDPGLVEPAGQPVVTVETELKTKGRPGGHSDIGQPEDFIDEVEVVMQASTPLVKEASVTSAPVVPSVIRRTVFHGREDMDPAGMTAPFLEDLLDPLFFTKVFVRANESDFQTGLGSELPGMPADLIAQGFGPVGVIPQSNALSPEKPRHGSGVPDVRQSSRDHDPVETGDDSYDLLPMAPDKRVPHDGSSGGCS